VIQTKQQYGQLCIYAGTTAPLRIFTNPMMFTVKSHTQSCLCNQHNVHLLSKQAGTSYEWAQNLMYKYYHTVSTHKVYIWKSHHVYTTTAMLWQNCSNTVSHQPISISQNILTFNTTYSKYDILFK